MPSPIEYPHHIVLIGSRVRHPDVPLELEDAPLAQKQVTIQTVTSHRDLKSLLGSRPP